MLSTNPETVCRLIELAHIVHGGEPVSIPEVSDSPADDWGQQILADHADNSAVTEFKSVIADLEPDQQQEVVALLWLGRGDYTLEEWEDMLAHAEDAWTPETADYLLAHPLLASHLEEGLAAHGHSCQESSFINPG